MRRLAPCLLVFPVAFVSTADARVSGNVAALQVALIAAGEYHGFVDGVRGPQTTLGVRAFQRRQGLVSDGIVGPNTRRRFGRTAGMRGDLGRSAAAMSAGM